MKRRALLGTVGAAWLGSMYVYGGGGDENGDSDASAGGEGGLQVRGESEGVGGDSATAFAPGDVETAIVDRINDQRAADGLPNLGRDSGLRLAAREHSRDMHERDFFAHKNPDGEQPWHRVPCEAGETLYKSPIATRVKGAGREIFDTTVVRDAAALVVDGWVASSEHYEIMTDGLFERVGVGVFESGGQFWATAMYC